MIFVHFVLVCFGHPKPLTSLCIQKCRLISLPGNFWQGREESGFLEGLPLRKSTYVMKGEITHLLHRPSLEFSRQGHRQTEVNYKVQPELGTRDHPSLAVRKKTFPGGISLPYRHLPTLRKKRLSELGFLLLISREWHQRLDGHVMTPLAVSA